MSINLNLNDMLEVRMAYDSERQKVLAQNISNIDTPDYQAQDLVPLNFKNILSNEMHTVTMALTENGHMKGGTLANDRFRTSALGNPFERTPTGGTVVVEQQMLKVAQNATDYQMTTSLYKKVSNLFLEAMGLQASG